MSDQLKLEDEEVSITLRRAWDRALRTLASRVNKPTFETHIRAIKPSSLTEQNDQNGRPLYEIVLGVPSAFTREWIEKRHSGLITGVLEEILDRKVVLRFILTPREKGTPAADSEQTLSLFGGDPGKASPPAPSVPAPPPAADPGDIFQLAPDDPRPRDLAPAVPAATATKSAPLPTRRSGAAPAAVASPSGRGTGYAESQTDAPHLNARYTFDNFVVGPTNRLAQAGAKAVADAPGKMYNPLFLYGPPGLGKTHLMHAIGNEVARARSGDGDGDGTVAYVSGESFTTHFITSLRERRTDEFRRRWRSVDVWLVDDIQFIAGKESTKEEFFHTFNALYQTGKQIVISSDRSPRDLRMMDERLRSRFECGLIADIAPPDLETRLAILHRKAEVERARIPDDVLLYMARLVQSNIRTLEGALVKLIAYASLVNSPVTTELASNVLERYYIAAGIGVDADDEEAVNAKRTGFPGTAGSDATTASEPSGSTGSAAAFATFAGRGRSSGIAITPDLVQRVVAKRFGMAPDALSGKRRDKDIVVARQVAMHLLRELTEISLPGIGQIFGGRDHKTVSYACDKVRGQMPMDDDLRRLVEDLMMQVKAQASE